MLKWMWGRPTMLVSPRFMVASALVFAFMGAFGWEASQAWVARHEVRWVGPVSIVDDPVHEWDLTSPWERCLAAVEAAELPAWMWECREYPDYPQDLP